MPLYEFSCENGHAVDVQMSIRESEENVIVCEICGQPMSKLISVTAKPQFRGNGFYETDYKPRVSEDK